jgi:hypothetical protein
MDVHSIFQRVHSERDRVPRARRNNVRRPLANVLFQKTIIADHIQNILDKYEELNTLRIEYTSSYKVRYEKLNQTVDLINKNPLEYNLQHITVYSDLMDFMMDYSDPDTYRTNKLLGLSMENSTTETTDLNINTGADIRTIKTLRNKIGFEHSKALYKNMQVIIDELFVHIQKFHKYMNITTATDTYKDLFTTSDITTEEWKLKYPKLTEKFKDYIDEDNFQHLIKFITHNISYEFTFETTDMSFDMTHNTSVKFLDAILSTLLFIYIRKYDNLDNKFNIVTKYSM